MNGLTVAGDGTVVAVGHTGGQLGAVAHGDKDAFALGLADDGTQRWVTQLGTATDDRGVTALGRSDGSVLLVGTTYGSLAGAVGGVDIFTAEIDASGTVGATDQFGSNDRDGSDEWDEASLFAARAGDGVLLTGLTFGAPDGEQNRGAGDVFVAEVAP